MRRFRRGLVLCYFAIVFVPGIAVPNILAQNSSSKGADPAPLDTADVLRQVDKLVEQNRQLENVNRELMDQISVLRRALAENSVAENSSQPPTGANQPPRELEISSQQPAPSL